jgi:hypothetical protein
MSPVAISRDFAPGRDESRLLIVGAQVLVGFQSRAAFEPCFEGLSRGAGHRATGVSVSPTPLAPLCLTTNEAVVTSFSTSDAHH